MSSLRSSFALPRAVAHSPDRPGFRSFKTAAAVHYPCRWHRDLLIQATLDSSVTRIEPCPADIGETEAFSVLVWFGERRRLLTATRDLIEPGYAVSGQDSLTVSRSFVLEEPRCSVAREIWSTRSVQIPPGDRIRILHELSRHVDGVPVQRLTECCRGSAADPVVVVLALVCAGQAVIDVRSRLSPETIVKRNTRPSETKSVDRSTNRL